jgi:hypothetical protein
MINFFSVSCRSSGLDFSPTPKAFGVEVIPPHFGEFALEDFPTGLQSAPVSQGAPIARQSTRARMLLSAAGRNHAKSGVEEISFLLAIPPAATLQLMFDWD